MTDKEFWQKVYCAAIISPDDWGRGVTYAKVADSALEQLKKRWPPNSSSAVMRREDEADN